MIKMKRSIFILCLLAFLCPFPAAAMPISEFVADVIGIEGGLPNVTLQVAFITNQPLVVQVNQKTEVRDLDLDNLEEGTRVKIHAVSTEQGLIALEVEPSVEPSYELKGRAQCDLIDRTIALIDGTVIFVPDNAEITDGAGNAVDFADLRGQFVKIEGDVVDGDFVVNEVTTIKEFMCPSNVQHIFTALKPTDVTHKMTEHYCQLSSGKRGGVTQISFTDYTGTDVSTYTVGKYNKGDRQGYWLTIDVTGNVVQECLYNKGNLLDGDLSCPE